MNPPSRFGDYVTACPNILGPYSSCEHIPLDVEMNLEYYGQKRKKDLQFDGIIIYSHG